MTTNSKLPQFNVQDEAPYLSDFHMRLLIGLPAYRGQLVGHEGQRLFAKVMTDRDCWCDVVTGQLYPDNTLRCLSGPQWRLQDRPEATGRKVPKQKRPIH